MVVRKGIALALSLAGLALLAPPAQAAFHLMKISEVQPGPSPAFIELQMFSPGQNFVGGHTVRTYDASGTPLHSFVMPGNVPNGENNRTILIGTSSGDFIDPTLNIPPSGGAVCFVDASPVDCVAWGNFAGTLPGAVGTPVAAAGIPAGSSISRTIAPGCATLLEPGDDTDVSSVDFALTAPSPRPNTAAVTEVACGSGGGSGDSSPPQTEITKTPSKKSEKTKAKFKFVADEQGSKFECKLDRGAFKSCASPRKYKDLDLGKHKFSVFAIDQAGNEDQSPATYRFKVVEK